jgi:hypothetical protein
LNIQGLNKAAYLGQKHEELLLYNQSLLDKSLLSAFSSSALIVISFILFSPDGFTVVLSVPRRRRAELVLLLPSSFDQVESKLLLLHRFLVQVRGRDQEQTAPDPVQLIQTRFQPASHRRCAGKYVERRSPLKKEIDQQTIFTIHNHFRHRRCVKAQRTCEWIVWIKVCV